MSAPAAAQQPAAQQPQPQAQAAPVSAPAAQYQNAASQVVVNAEEVNATVAQLMAMGFEHDQVVRALRAAFNNPERAADYLLNGIPEVPAQQQGLYFSRLLLDCRLWLGALVSVCAGVSRVSGRLRGRLLWRLFCSFCFHRQSSEASAAKQSSFI